ncbi:MAG: AAA family ATPase, partial [Thermoanaerobaculia bacterium]
MSHPSLVSPITVGRDARTRRFYLVRPYVEGSDLPHALKGRLPMEMLPWLLAAAEALAILHRFRVAHGNVKLSNLFVPGTALTARSLREPKVILCDPAYWPARAGEIPFTSDLNALGAVFHQILSGRSSESPAELPSLAAGEMSAEVPIDLGRVVMALLRPDVGRRYPDAQHLAGELRHLLGNHGKASWGPPECFLGRKEELVRAQERLGERVERGTQRWAPVAIAVTGEEGAGKSAFLRRLRLQAQLLGYRTHSVHCYEAAAPLPALRSLMQELIPRGTRGRAMRARYRRLLEETSGPPRRIGPDPGLRRRFIRGFADLLFDAAGLEPNLLVLDDAHLADPLTVECLASLVGAIGSRWRQKRGAGRGALSLAVSYRAESPFRASVRSLVEAFGQPGQGHLVIEIPPLSLREVEEWVQRVLG